MKGQSSFHATWSGWCRGCHERYRKGENIWSPAKGGGAFHIKCQPPIETRQASPDEIQALRQRSELRKRGIYSS
jgi:hypothetical protein